MSSAIFFIFFTRFKHSVTSTLVMGIACIDQKKMEKNSIRFQLWNNFSKPRKSSCGLLDMGISFR